MQYPLYIVEVVSFFFLFKKRRDLINPLCIYCTDMSVLLENIPIVIVVFIKATSGIDDVIARYFPVRYSCLYVIKRNITQWLEDMNFIFLRQKRVLLTSCMRWFVKYCFVA